MRKSYQCAIKWGFFPFLDSKKSLFFPFKQRRTNTHLLAPHPAAKQSPASHGPLLWRGHITGYTCVSAHEPCRRSPNRSVFTHFPVWNNINKTRSWIRKWNLCFLGAVMATPNCFIWTPVYVFDSHQYLWHDSGLSADEETNDGRGNDTGACCISLPVFPVWAETWPFKKKEARIFKAVLASFFKGPTCNIISPPDVVVLPCMYTKTNWLPAGPQWPPM